MRIRMMTPSMISIYYLTILISLSLSKCQLELQLVTTGIINISNVTQFQQAFRMPPPKTYTSTLNTIRRENCWH